MKNILFIAFEFPPLKKGGVFRPLGFAKHLQYFGYNPIVVTVSKVSLEDSEEKLDYNLGREARETMTIIEVDNEVSPLSEKSRLMAYTALFFSPIGREKKSWQKNFNRVIPNVINEYNPKLIFITAPPFSLIDIAIDLKKKYRLPLVIDLRDAWSNWFMTPYYTVFHYLYVRYKECTSLKSADALVATSLQTIEDYKTLVPDIAENKINYIPNGFDGKIKEWKNIELNDEIKIGYVGSFYYSPKHRLKMISKWWQRRGLRKLNYVPNNQDWSYRSPKFFFEIISALIIKYPELKNRLTLQFVGLKPPWFDAMVEEANLEEVVKHIGVLSHKKSLAFQQECAALLITSSKVIGGRDYSIAGKTYEYFKNQRPIIAVTQPGAQHDILKNSGIALMLDPENIITSVVKFKKFLDGRLVLNPNIDFINSFCRKKLTKKLTMVFNNALNKK